MANLPSTQNNRSISNQISISDLYEQTLKELKKYEEIVYNTFLPFYVNKYLFKINKED